MSELQRPDGATIHYEQWGEGPLVLLVFQFFGSPEICERLVAELSGDHHVVGYDVRGVGGSSAAAVPSDRQVDADDLIALLESLDAGPAVLVTFGDGVNRSVRVAAQRPELVAAVLSPAGNPLVREAAKNTEALVGSDSVVEAMTNQIGTDYRGAMRSLMTAANPQMSDDQLRERVQQTIDYCPREVAMPRMRMWVDDDVSEEARAIGAKLILLEHGTNPWFPKELAARTKELLPECRVIDVENGPLSRPDITADHVRRIFSAKTAVASESDRAG